MIKEEGWRIDTLKLPGFFAPKSTIFCIFDVWFSKNHTLWFKVLDFSFKFCKKTPISETGVGLGKGLWLDWLEAIRHPRSENAVLLFRGLDPENDHPQVVTDENNKEIGHGFFSTLLNRNQGSFTRRLRSLTTMRYRLQNLSNSRKSPIEATPTISSMMFNHAQYSSCSPMLSFSASLSAAIGFGQEYGVIAAKIDSRRVLPNIASPYARELELLVPLIVFPDEIVHFEKSKPKISGNGVAVNIVNESDFANSLNEKLGHDYTRDISLNRREVFIKAYRVFADADLRMEAGMCRQVFMK